MRHAAAALSVGRSGFATHTQMHYLETEQTLSARLGETIEHPVRLFDLDGLGIDFAQLRRDVLPSFADLPWDDYDAKRDRVELLRARCPGHEERLAAFLPAYFAGQRDLDELADLVDALSPTDAQSLATIRPSRRRALATFAVRKSHAAPLGWELERQAAAPFTQAADHQADYRSFERRFAETPTAVTDAVSYRKVIRRVATLADAACNGALTSLRIACHQMHLVARPDTPVSNAPEGIHQDGSDYIVSALVLDRRGVEGGESVVFGPDQRTEYLRHTLQEGQGIFQADAGSPLWHWVTPIRPADLACPLAATRSVLGYDVHLD